MDEVNTVLFLCTGNYYRSRFAEETFNFHAQQRGVDWRADSAGLKVIETRHENPGPISEYALRAFVEYGVIPKHHQREPKQLSDRLLNDADLLIATSIIEHQPMAEESIPHYTDKITYWDVEDVEFEIPAVALKNLHERTLALLARLEND